MSNGSRRGNGGEAENNPFAFDNDSGDDLDQGSYHSSVFDGHQGGTGNSQRHNHTTSVVSGTPQIHFDRIEHASGTHPVELPSNNGRDDSTSSLRLDRLEPPKNARLSSSPKRQSVAHMRDSSYSNIVYDPFNSAFDDDDDDDDDNDNDNDTTATGHHLYSESSHDLESKYLPKGANGVTVDVYENSNESSTNNLVNTPMRNTTLAFPNQSPGYDYSPSDSFQNLGYYTNLHQQQQQPLFVNTNGGFPDEHSESSPVFQSFERDPDEPELDNNQLFENSEENLQNGLERSNFADKGDNKVELIDGKYYSFDYPVPTQLSNKIPFAGARQMTEFTHLRYHAITADPKEYTDDNPMGREYIENYPFRHNVYSVQRETELMIVCTMYNEDELLLGRTLKGVFKNIKTMYNLNEDESIHPFGKNSWKKIVVVIVSDGKNKINERSKALLTLLGVFQEGIMQESVNDKKVNAHLFEYTTTFGIGKFDYNRANHSFTVPLVTEQTVPVQLMFLLKEENKQKINSHRWALNFLCPNLNPKVVVLLDVGTEPGPDSIYKLWKAFKDPKIGGACGEIRAMLGNHASPNDESSIWKKMGRLIYFKLSDFAKCVMNPLVAAQNFEYKMSNILDKPTESAFGFVTVLPGAFSAYRYEALQGEPLRAYFHGEDMKSNTKKPAGVLESNMYLAEDRILCFELVAKSEKSYLLQYVYNSYAVTDVPSQINEFINQRRRWLNGSFFAALYSILHFYRILVSKHSFRRKIMLVIEIIYQTVNILLSWFALSIYFLVFRILALDLSDTFVGEKTGDILAIVFLWVYIAAIVLTFIISFGNKPNDAKYFYMLAFALFAVIVIYMTFCVVCLTIQSIETIKEDIGEYSTFTLSIGLKYLRDEKFRDLTVSLASTYVLYIIGSLIFFDVFHLFACTVQYLLLSPAYINVLGIFAFCNINDISWGTKGALGDESKAPKKQANTDNDEEKNVLLLSENLENPDVLYKKAQQFLEGTSEHGDGNEISEKTLLQQEQDQIKENIRTSEKNYALGRTYTVLLWLISNFILLVIILRTGGLEDYSDYINGQSSSTSTSSTSTTNSYLMKRNYWNNMNVANYFMTAILWIVAALALVRLCGCVYYRISFFVSERVHHRSAVLRE